MHPALTVVLARLEQSRAALREAIARVPPHQRDQPPASDRWSVAGVLEHLALVDERSTGILGSKIAEARAALPPEEGDPALLPSNLEAMLTDRTESAAGACAPSSERSPLRGGVGARAGVACGVCRPHHRG